MRTKIVTTLLLGAFLVFTSCSDSLDLDPTNSISDKLAWSKVEYAELAINNFYHDINYYGNFHNGQSTAGMTEGFTDIFKYGAMNYNSHAYIPNELAYGGSVLTVSYVSVYLGNWKTVYTKVRRINEGLYNLKKYSTMNEADNIRLEAEMRFFRALNYFDLVKRYKQVIIYDDDLTQINTDKALSSEAEGWDFVQTDLEFAGQNLRISPEAHGRVTSGAAYALLSRAMLYAERWDIAKSAAEKVTGYELTPNFVDAFKSNSSEAILQYSYDKSAVNHNFDNYYAPGGDAGNNTTGGYGTPTQEMVESFELATTGGFPDWSPWHNEQGTSDAPPYAQLEPRFQATVLYNGVVWKGRTIEPYVGGTDGWASWRDDAVPAGRTTTGYYLRKLVDESHDFVALTASTQPWIAIRYAEVLLNKAEACYHLGDNAGANAAIRAIRSRVGLPYNDKTGDALMAAIRQERKVELAYEGQYYWDMKRWKLAESAFTGIRVHGQKIEKNADNTFTYTYVDCDKQNRNFPSKMYQIPLPIDELNNNTLVQQYPEWR
ncbi:RagB/SusD family nutrient uptake outer membrane protein [Parabacteroides sp. Marseille-P3160]|uniref:RagB/SusD family nutrient uptake outer membrane protein n=1 Tax=Parabacteroides sp. Marseille-P3160 TaxID=1917887 RepID=UPI0009BAB653|nr:RagB/SusD family nutrient uptake outer membrane protein [Parabacteroides sp. Marseille-P3160]